MGCTPLKMGVFGRILEKKERITGILRETGEESGEKKFRSGMGISAGIGCLPVNPCRRILKKVLLFFVWLCESSNKMHFSRAANVGFDISVKARGNQLFHQALIVNIVGFFLKTWSILV
jgi:hypothetical protein